MFAQTDLNSESGDAQGMTLWRPEPGWWGRCRFKTAAVSETAASESLPSFLLMQDQVQVNQLSRGKAMRAYIYDVSDSEDGQAVYIGRRPADNFCGALAAVSS
jgi:hypothetical protein